MLLLLLAGAAVAAAAVGAGVAVTAGGSAEFAAQETPTPTATDGHGDAGGGHGGSGHGDGGDGEMGMTMDMEMVPNGTVVNGNAEELPPGCDAVAGERAVTVRGGHRFAEAGEMFAFDRERIQVAPCTRLSVTFVNEDSVRHQWMIHGLPTETYPMGMFNVEVNGPGSVTGTLITPSGDHTFTTHCSLPQHEQKGMHMELVVGDGGNGSGGHDHGAGGDGHDHTHGTAGAGPGFGLLGALVAAACLAAVGLRRRR